VFEVGRDDDALLGLKGLEIRSVEAPGVAYRVGELLGAGGMAYAFFAVRGAPDGQTPVVLKVMRPSVVRGAGSRSALVFRKEYVALGRLNERVPPTPFVVRLIDAGELPARAPGGASLELPWLAVEHVHGGAEGTTLADRVAQSVRRTGFAFDPARAAHAIECLAAGLDAVHDVGVIHRDVTPANVLCCGFGEDEILKLADFGVARPEGMAATFGGLAIGTPGYAPPEQFLLDATRIGRWSDVFSLACVAYFILTGEHYFAAGNPLEALAAAKLPERRRLMDARSLCPELRAQPSVCASIDAALARATAADAALRPDRADVLARMIVPVLRPESSRPRASQRRVASLIGWQDSTVLGGWSFSVRHLPGDDRVVRGAAWDGDGRCLVATQRGLELWNGTSWLQAPLEGLDPEGIHFVRRMAAGTWLVGGDGAEVAVYGSRGITRRLSAGEPGLSFVHASGDPADLAVFVALRDGAPSLYAMTGGRWLRPAQIARASVVTALARLGDATWLVAGRDKEGQGFAAIYEPLLWSVRRVATPGARAYLGAAAQPDLGVGVVVGTSGRTVRIDAEQPYVALVEGEPDVSAVGMDVSGRAWAAGASTIFMQSRDRPDRWTRVWHDARWTAPFVSIAADVGLVAALTADGGIVEGRLAGRVAQ
jgi:serine/threonine protein kinase